MANAKKTPVKYDPKAERESVGATQGDVAEGIGVTQAAVSKWESYKTRLRGPALRQFKQFIAARRRANKRKAENEQSGQSAVQS